MEGLVERTCVHDVSHVRVDLMLGYSFSSFSLVWKRLFSVRPKMEMLEAPDFANQRAISGPIPEPLPDMTMFLPLVESWGNVALMAG